MRNKKEKINKFLKTIGRLTLGIVIVMLFFAAIYLILHLTLGIEFSDFKDREKIQMFIEQSGGFGKLIYIIISFLQVTILPIPGVITVIVGNYLFNFFDTLWMTSLGVILGSLLSFYVGRKVGRPFVNWVLGDKHTADKYLKKVQGKETLLFFLMFIFPLFPDDPLCSVAGISKIKFKNFLFIQLVARPISIAATLIFATGEIIPFKGWGILLLILLFLIMLLIAVVVLSKVDEINNFFNKLCKKIMNFRHNK